MTPTGSTPPGAVAIGSPPAPTGSEYARHWLLDRRVAYLNHGSFGACPQAVLDRQAHYRNRLERQPVDFLVRHLDGLLDAARQALGDLLGADPSGLVPVSNATEGVNAALAALDLRRGDRVLVTDHIYNACRNALEHLAERTGIAVDVALVPFPLVSDDDVVAAIGDALRPNTRAALLDHVTSATGLVMPLARIVEVLHARDVAVVVDGAHAPGMLALSIEALGVAYYAGNCHKWLCAPKGAGFLYVHPAYRERTRPPVISHGANRRRPGRTRLHDEFDWTGTRDASAFLCVGHAVTWLGALLPGGWTALRDHNRQLALAGRQLLCDALQVDLPAPAHCIGSLASVPLPSARLGRWSALDSARIDPLQAALREQYQIEVPVMGWGAGRLIRISAQAYNHERQYRYLAASLMALLD